MRNCPRVALIVVLAPGFSAPLAAHAEVKLPAIFGDHMVLQKDRPIPFWGTAAPKEPVTVEVAGKTARGVADAGGKFRVTVPALPAGGPHEVVVTGSNRVTFSDVLVGEVWLASGQSNMEFSLEESDGGEAASKRAANPNLRLFQVRHGEILARRGSDVDGRWLVAGPDSARNFSAVAYHFAQPILSATGGPVGLINTSWGGTPIEAWTDVEAVRRLAPGLVPKKLPTPEEEAAATRAYEEALERWDTANRQVEPANSGEGSGFALPQTSTAGWGDFRVPGIWEDTGIKGDGTIWFRTQVALPRQWAGKALSLSLGRLSDCDVAYVNGERVGETCRHTPDRLNQARAYNVPARLARAGMLTVAVRIFDERGRGGFVSGPGALYLRPVDAPTTEVSLPLAGTWKYKVETLLPTMEIKWTDQPKAGRRHPHPHTVGGLWDMMIAPLVPFAIRGALWYQGETNATRAHQYRSLFPGLIKAWRRAWGQGDFPFYFVQLAGFRLSGSEQDWAELREAQTMTMKVQNTGMVVAIDIGNPTDIHPTNKQEVGRRLSLWALDRVYHKRSVVSGPLYSRSRIDKGAVRIWFSFADGLHVRAGESDLQGFMVAGADGKFVPAQARIEGDTVVVSSGAVTKPVAVRYGWEGAPSCNLENAANLPASPFRTDHFAEVTRGRE